MSRAAAVLLATLTVASCGPSGGSGRIAAALTAGNVDAATFDRLESITIEILQPAPAGTGELTCTQLLARTAFAFAFDAAAAPVVLDLRASSSASIAGVAPGVASVWVEAHDALGVPLAAACAPIVVEAGRLTEVSLALLLWGDLDGDGITPAGGDCNDRDPLVWTGFAELCDDRDNDCDGAVDEDCACAPAGAVRSCFGAAPGAVGIGPCALGGQTCDPMTLRWSDCAGQVLPSAEVCVDPPVDEDCDGSTNEGCPCVEDFPCFGAVGPPTGACVAGLQACVDQIAGTCVGQVLPVPEVCPNGLDDDCDGVADENCPCQPGDARACYPGPATEILAGSPCAEGMQSCGSDGLWSACTGAVVPSAEGSSCNGADDDCDGLIDDIVAACYDLGGGGCDTDGTGCAGICRPGYVDCAGAATTCVGAVGPSGGADVCGDGIDDNCDGQVDEGGVSCRCDDEALTNPSLTCWLGPPVATGECASGAFSCVGNQPLGTCQGATGPATETCNGLDDDCDGFTDNAVTGLDAVAAPIVVTCGGAGTEGLCRGGTMTCAGGTLGPCTGLAPPAPEQCDGLDHDCDGEVNDVDEDGDDYFGCGNTLVVNRDCDDYDPFIHPGAFELCDGVDNDCDGVIDGDTDLDGFGPCPDATGAFDCDEGDPLLFPGATEQCNDRDDDCDGALSMPEMDGDGDGAAPCEGDCDDADPNRSPSEPEICDPAAFDSDCVANNETDACFAGENCCGGSCTLATDPSSCGAACTDCTVLPGADGCAAGACSCGAGPACGAASPLCCAGTCATGMSVSACGPTCTVCGPESNGCDGTACTCNTGGSCPGGQFCCPAGCQLALPCL